MEIHRTQNYDLFQIILSNREVDASHVKKLARSIQRKNLLYVRPVIVNNKMQVIDGQHRIEACKLLNEPVYYIIADHLTKDDIAILNTAQKNWSRNDFINFYAIEGREKYKDLSKLINKYQKVPVSTLVSLACGRGTKIREGEISSVNTTRTTEVFDWIMDLHKNRNNAFVTTRNFVTAFNQVVRTEDEFLPVLVASEDASKFHICDSRDSYKTMLRLILPNPKSR
jgi:hypothetical protein